ncbi:hypothetical protein ACFO0S_03745 [Chryseomicrobium palamuruense]|uniref:Lipoprotein n=1 Tax=Chryseomicrobium palamuruense TaxID=682973 RepID=A0ABV8UUK6_9BACL
MKKYAWILGASTILLLGACGDEDVAPDTPTEQEAQQADDISDNAPGVEPVEQDISTKYSEMDEVAGARVGDRDGVIEARIMFTDTPSEDEAKAIAEEFAKELKEQYTDQPVTVTAVQSGKTLSTLEME